MAKQQQKCGPKNKRYVNSKQKHEKAYEPKRTTREEIGAGKSTLSVRRILKPGRMAMHFWTCIPSEGLQHICIVGFTGRKNISPGNLTLSEQLRSTLHKHCKNQLA